VKAAVITALTIPLLFLAPAVAQAQPNLPLNPSPDQECATTQQIVNTVRAKQPGANPEQIATAYDQMMAAKIPGYQLFQGQQHQQLLDLIHACGLG
jgi:hypothetical protein